MSAFYLDGNIREKGNSLPRFFSDFVVIDIETTGLSPDFDSIIEFSGIRVRNYHVVDRFETLIKPPFPVSPFITELTGITNDMLEQAPTISEVIINIRSFLADDVIVGHNVNFDINFLYDAMMTNQGVPLSNDFVDTMRLSRKALPELDHHRLSDIAVALNVAQSRSHRAMEDCETTLACFVALRELVLSKMSEDEFSASFKKKTYPGRYDLSQITSEKETFDETHPLYKKYCVFTGVLERMTRNEAARLVVDCGGFCENSVTKKTNYLVLGNNDYNPHIKEGKSNKQKKAEAYKLAGQDIDVIPESVFYELVENFSC